MLLYFIIFIVIGSLIGEFIKNIIFALGIIIIISIFWAFGFGPWGFATFFELIIGYAIGITYANGKSAMYNESVDHKTPSIEITTEGHTVEIGVGGSGAIYIDWGDCSPIEKYFRLKSAKEEEYATLFSDKPDVEMEYDENGIGKEVIKSLYGNGWIRHEYDSRSKRHIKIYGKNITFIDLHFASALINQEFTALDVTRCETLKFLKCSDCKIEKLDLRNNSKLSYLDSSGTYLDELNIENNKNIKFLDCSGNSLKALDLSQNKSLITLDCSFNQLTVLDISNNKKLLKLDCWNDNLEKLILNNNKRLEIEGDTENMEIIR